MDRPEEQFEQLLVRVRTGDSEALGMLFERYRQPVQMVVRRLLRASLRRRYDSADFVQSVWLSFVQIAQEKYEFESPKDLVAFLARLAYNKVAGTTRQRFGTGKHDVNRETSLDIPTKGGDPDAQLVPGPTPTPSQIAVAGECWARIIQGLPSGHVRVLELLREGYTYHEINHNLGVHPKVIQRLLNRLRHYTDLP
jgi:DNA-directed RNA polymerase specialized sigma24 family protein